MPPSDDQPAVAQGVPTRIVSFAGADPVSGTRAIPAEVAVEVVYANVPFAVMMMTPQDVEDFGYGFSLTEGIIRSADEIRSVRLSREAKGQRLLVELAPGRLSEHLSRRRALSGRTGCGVCGIDDLDALPRAREPEGKAPVVTVGAIDRALRNLEAAQPLNDETRAVHAAAFADLSGQLVAVREDVGRHNALDKLVGACLRAGVRPESGFVVVTSRCSFEMVEKTAAFGARTLVAISAPTTFALERAKRLDVALVAIARRDTMTVFHGGERIREAADVAADVAEVLPT